MFEEKKFSFIRPVVHAKFLGYAYAYFCNPGQYYIGTTANNQGVIKKYKNIYSLKIKHKLIATYILINSNLYIYVISLFHMNLLHIFLFMNVLKKPNSS